MTDEPFPDPIEILRAMQRWSAADLGQLLAELDGLGLPPGTPADLFRAQGLAVRFTHDQQPATLKAALSVYEACPVQGPARGFVGRYLVLRHIQGGTLGLPFDTGRIRALIDDAGDDPAAPGTAELLQVFTDVLAAVQDDPGYDRPAALARLDTAAAAIPPGSPLAHLVPLMRTALAVRRGGEHGVYADATAAAEQARSLLAGGELDEQQRLRAEILVAGAQAMADAQQGRPANAVTSAQTIMDLVDRLPPGDPGTEAMRRHLAGVTGASRAANATAEGLAAGERTWRLLVAATPVIQAALERKDSAGLAKGVRMLREAAETAPPGYPHIVLIDTQLGGLLCARYQLGAGRPALDEALRRLESARRRAGHPGHPLWTSCLMALGLAYRLDGRLARGRETGLQALRGHAWAVLLQAGTADAATAARHAAEEAKQVARWCLADGDAATAGRALDAGRCLMLYAATVTVDVPERLRGLGRADLLARWQSDAEDADLRSEVLTAITGELPAEGALPDVLDPPEAGEIGAALTDVRADVLIYLLPRDDEGAGCAVLVPAQGVAAGRVTPLTLPGLATTGLVARHIDVLGSRDAGPDSEGGGELRDDLDGLCDWAWTAAIGPILSVLDRWRIGRAPRIVLVPMGDLAAVPWHAARDRDGTRAIEVATFSYAASARLLCQNAERPPVDPAGPVLMVGDPTGDLPDALAEAAAIRDAFYPAAAFPAAATPETVREWLLGGGGAVLHLACHGAALPGIDGSHLRLAGGRLTALDILRTRRRAAIGLVALAACTTGMPSGAYDEAFSLTTAFHAAGARSVFGSLWPVPSDATSLLMFMAHHFLRAAGKRPVDALNHAQRWMLDPERAIPAGMPPALADQVPHLTADVAAWAGFTHHGR